MRLTDTQRQGLRDATSAVLGPSGWVLLLYGSRLDDAARGGDIDLLLIVEPTERAAQAAPLKFRLLSTMKAHIGDQRIDLSIGTRADFSGDAFYAEVLETAQAV